MTPEEWSKWTDLTQKIRFENGRIPLEAFYAWSEYLYAVTVELIPFRIIDGELEMLLIYRKDKYYDGYHNPGAVIPPGESIDTKLQKLIKEELGNDAVVKKLEFVKHFEL